MGNACTTAPIPSKHMNKARPIDPNAAVSESVKSSSSLASVTNAVIGANERTAPGTMTISVSAVNLQSNVPSSEPPSLTVQSRKVAEAAAAAAAASLSSAQAAETTAAGTAGTLNRSDSNASSSSQIAFTSLDSYSLRLPFSFLSLGTRLKRAAPVCKLWSQLAKLPPLRSGKGDSEYGIQPVTFAETHLGSNPYYPLSCGCSEDEVTEEPLKYMIRVPTAAALVCCLKLRYGFALVDLDKRLFPWAQVAMKFQTLRGLTIHLSQTHFPISLQRMIENIQFPPQLQRLSVHFGSTEGHSAVSRYEDVFVMEAVVKAIAPLRVLQHLLLEIKYPSDQTPRLISDGAVFLAPLEQHGSKIQSLRLLGMMFAGGVAPSLQFLSSLTHLTMLTTNAFPVLPSSLVSLDLWNSNSGGYFVPISALPLQQLPRNLAFLRSVQCESLEHVQRLGQALPSLANLCLKIPTNSLTPIPASTLLSSLSQCSSLALLVLSDVKIEGVFSWSHIMSALPHLSSLCLMKISPPLISVAPLLEPGRIRALSLFDAVVGDALELALTSHCLNQLQALAFGDKSRERLEVVRRMLDPKYDNANNVSSSSQVVPAPEAHGRDNSSLLLCTSRLPLLSELRLEEFSGPHRFYGSDEERLVQLLWERGNPFPSQLLGIEKEEEPYDIDSDPLYNNLWCK